MAGVRRSRARRAKRKAEPDDDNLGEFLRRVGEVEAEDPDELARWTAFFARLRRLWRSPEEPSE